MQLLCEIPVSQIESNDVIAIWKEVTSHNMKIDNYWYGSVFNQVPYFLVPLSRYFWSFVFIFHVISLKIKINDYFMAILQHFSVMATRH